MRKWSGCKLPLKISRAIDLATEQVYKDENFKFSEDIKFKDQIRANDQAIRAIEQNETKDQVKSNDQIESNDQITSEQSSECEVVKLLPLLFKPTFLQKKASFSLQNKLKLRLFRFWY